MVLSEATIEILKNFSTLNKGLIVKPGKILQTYSSSSTVFAEAELQEEFESEFAIYDLTKTLGIISMSKGAPVDITVEKDKLVFSGVGKIRQRFAVASLIHGHDVIGKKLPFEAKIGFNLTADAYNWIISTASILGAPNIVIKSDDDVLSMYAMDVKGQMVDDASMQVGVGEDVKGINAVLKIENLNILKGGYRVELSNRMAKFIHHDKKVKYYISLEKTS
jgi:hypothetical protein